jgi:hypothetical protein
LLNTAPPDASAYRRDLENWPQSGPLLHNGSDEAQRSFRLDLPQTPPLPQSTPALITPVVTHRFDSPGEAKNNFACLPQPLGD